MSKAFLLMAFIGPFLVLALTYLLFAIGGEHKSEWNVLVSDPKSLLDTKILTKEDPSIHYFFANDYIEIEDFAKGEKYQKFDALLEVNEKIISNKCTA